MSPLFIPKQHEDELLPPTTIPVEYPHVLPPERSTPEGQEPDRNDEQPQKNHDEPNDNYNNNKNVKNEKKFPRRPSTAEQHDDPHHHGRTHHRYSLSSDNSNYYSNYSRGTRSLSSSCQPPICSSALRKYVLLVQDCVAIKFVRTNRITGGGSEDPSVCRPASSSSSEKYGPSQDKLLQQTLDGVALFKSFVTCNKKCYWNGALSEAVISLEYKGCVHPSTILVTTSTRNMNVLRNAWSRRILQHPPGFRAELLGEVEELVAQPVQQGQFAPLSDSLCWTITELTESGEEAFIDSIQSKLHTTFPSISQPPKELIFQTLEKLIREQKIYQTSHGYYIVTPDISTYVRYSRAVSPAPSSSSHYYTRIHDLFEKPRRYTPPWGSTPSVSNDAVSSEDAHHHKRRVGSTPNNLLKRHNSLKIIRNKHESTYQIHNHPTMGARSLSFRLSKCNSLFESDKETDDDEDDDDKYYDEDEDEYMASRQRARYSTPQQEGLVTPATNNVTSAWTQTSNKKRRSLLSRLFTFRCTTTSKRDKQLPVDPQRSSPQQQQPPRITRTTPPKMGKPEKNDPTTRLLWQRDSSTNPIPVKHQPSLPSKPRVPAPRRAPLPEYMNMTPSRRASSSSPSTVSGTYASITERNTITERVTRRNVGASKRCSNTTSKSLYDLQSEAWRESHVHHLSDDVSH